MIEKIRAYFINHKVLGIALLVSVTAAIYWIAIASNRYVSDAHILVQRTDLPGGQTTDLSSLISGASPGRSDQLLLREHLLSIDMLKKLDSMLDLRSHFSDGKNDFLSRMWFRDASMEWFHRHFLRRVQIELDDYSGVLVIRAQAYTPQMAQRISSMLVSEGEQFMNELAHQLALAQVVFLEQQVVGMNERVLKTRQAILNYQNKKGLAFPQSTAESLAAILSRLEAQRSELQTQRAALQAYLVKDHPNIVMLNQQIAAVENQISREQSKLASSSGTPLNRTMEEFQRLEMEASFALDVYKTALSALEKGRIEAARAVKKVSILQAPTLPEYPMEPRRYYNTLVFSIVTLLLAGVAYLLMAIVLDHTD